MILSAKGYPIAQRFQMMHNALRAIIGKGVVRIGTAFDRIDPGVEVVACRGAHWRSLEAVGKLHALCGEALQIRRVGLTSVNAEVSMRQIIRIDEDHVRQRSCCRGLNQCETEGGKSTQKKSAAFHAADFRRAELFFIGTETSYDNGGYIEGALVCAKSIAEKLTKINS